MKKIMKYTFENSFTTLLNEEGKKLIDCQLKKLKCKVCGGSLCRVTYLEGDVVYCEPVLLNNWHDTGYDIDVNSNPPKIIRSKF